MRWDLIDKFDILKTGHYARAWKSFSGREDFFLEHEPSHPRVPEPFFIEMIAQAGGVLFGLGLEFKKEVILAKIEETFFPREVTPPCRLLIEARVEEAREEGAWISGQVHLGTELVAKAHLMLVSMDALVENSSDKVVFNRGFLKHYDVWNVAKKSEAIKI